MSVALNTAASALVLFAHGSHDPQWAEPFRTLQRRLAQKRPELAVELAFLELMQPSLPDALERLAETHARITIAPLFMGKGAHVRRDLVQLIDGIRKRHPEAQIDVLTAVGEAEPVLEAISAWLSDQV